MSSRLHAITSTAFSVRLDIAVFLITSGFALEKAVPIWYTVIDGILFWEV